jgi:hypothetical protein
VFDRGFSAELFFELVQIDRAELLLQVSGAHPLQKIRQGLRKMLDIVFLQIVGELRVQLPQLVQVFGPYTPFLHFSGYLSQQQAFG